MAGDGEERLFRMEAELRKLKDKQEIHDALMGYCRGLDRADAELITNTFHEDGVADHGIMFFTAADIGTVLPPMARQQMVMHFVGNVLIELDGDTAYSEAYFISFTEAEREGQTSTFSRGARYIDHWERRDGAWRIAYRVVVGSWDRVDPVLERHPSADKYYVAVPSPDDPVFTIKTGRTDLGRRRDPGGDKALEGQLLEEFNASLASAGFTADSSETA